jgi:hypothetical protein
MFLNHYECPRCDCAWSDAWSCQVDDDCPGCGLRHISPEYSSEFDDDCAVAQEAAAYAAPPLPCSSPLFDAARRAR